MELSHSTACSSFASSRCSIRELVEQACFHSPGSAPRAVWSCHEVWAEKAPMPASDHGGHSKSEYALLGCKGMQQKTWFYWKKAANIHEIQLLREARNWYLNSGVKCTIHGVANFGLAECEYRVSAVSRFCNTLSNYEKERGERGKRLIIAVSLHSVPEVAVKHATGCLTIGKSVQRFISKTSSVMQPQIKQFHISLSSFVALFLMRYTKVYRCQRYWSLEPRFSVGSDFPWCVFLVPSQKFQLWELAWFLPQTISVHLLFAAWCTWSYLILVLCYLSETV